VSDPTIVLSVNAGSSSLKLALFRFASTESTTTDRTATDPTAGEPLTELWRWSGEGLDFDGGLAALAAAGQPEPDAVGHRVVHGGTRFTAPVVIDADVLAGLVSLISLAPLHEPAAIAGIEAITAARPAVAQVACFDTAFHRTLPVEAARLPLQRRFWDAGIRRYGFHGLSYEFVVDHVGADRLGRAVIAHLGHGASLCAVVDGQSVDTTMGFTPAGGIVMGTRSGDLDPGVVLHLLATDRVAGEVAEVGSPDRVAAVDRLINHESGLLGLSGSTSDMRDLLAARAAGDGEAALAIAVFTRTVRKQIGAYAALLGGLDTVVFAGGIGEGSAVVRAEVTDGLGFLGVTVDSTRNAAVGRLITAAHEQISPDGSPVEVLVVATDEDRMIARHTARLIDANRGDGGSISGR
jgi:acetate kinase